MSELLADGLIDFIDGSPTPYHAVARARARLVEAGFRELLETDAWELARGGRHFVTRGDGTIAAFVVGSESVVEAGFRIVGAHTDSPNLHLKPNLDRTSDGYRQLSVETYGGVLLHTWLDRDLGIAGRVSFRGADGATVTDLVEIRRPVAHIPNLAIHLNREIRTEGVQLNPELHSTPIVGLEASMPTIDLVATELGCAVDDVFGFDLMLFDIQRSAVGGTAEEFLFAPRLDNLASCHSALEALVRTTGAPATPWTQAIALYDHEEIGSRTTDGAAGNFLESLIERITEVTSGPGRSASERARRHSMLVSADMAHAVHPNYADRHDTNHRPILGGGPVLKTNANRSYATDARTAGRITELARRHELPLQHFAGRNDRPCGSTIGPISATRTGISTADIGNPMLSMHSIRETAGTADIAPMIELLAAFLEDT